MRNGAMIRRQARPTPGRRLPIELTASLLASALAMATACREQEPPRPAPSIPSDRPAPPVGGPPSAVESKEPPADPAVEEARKAKLLQYEIARHEFLLTPRGERATNPKAAEQGRLQSRLLGEIVRDRIPLGTPRWEVVGLLGVPHEHIDELVYLYEGRDIHHYWVFNFDPDGRLINVGEYEFRFR